MTTTSRVNFSHAAACVLTAAFANAAHAQSNVTLFGLLDLNVTNTSPGGNVASDSVWTMNDGTLNGLNGSRWGIRASEDLGSGLKASVLLESGLFADTGALAQGGRAFGRQAFIGLGSATAGEVRFGRQYVLSDSVIGQGNPFGNALVNNPTTSVTNMGANLPLWLNGLRADNTIQYQSPSFAGLSAAAQLGLGEGTSDRFHGLRLTYGNGGLYTGLVYEWNKPRAGGDNTNKSLTLTANYDFGALKLLGGVQRNRDLTTGSGNGPAAGVNNLTVTGESSFTMNQSDGVTAGVEVPFGSTTLGVNYTRVKYESAAGADAGLGKFAVGVRHGLSKNTFLYAGASIATGELKDYISQERVVQAGVRTTF